MMMYGNLEKYIIEISGIVLGIWGIWHSGQHFGLGYSHEESE